MITEQEHALAGMVPHLVRDGWLYGRSVDRRCVAWRLDETATRIRTIKSAGVVAERIDHESRARTPLPRTMQA